MFNPFSPQHEPGFGPWKQGIENLPSTAVLVREADQADEDGLWMRWIQAECESTYIHSVEENVSKIDRQFVLLAELAGHPVGFCCAVEGRSNSDPLFIQLVAVVPSARQRGVGLALLCVAAAAHSQRNVAMAALDDNIAAQRLNRRLAQSIGAKIQRVPVNRFRKSDLGVASGEHHRPWMIDRQSKAD